MNKYLLQYTGIQTFNNKTYHKYKQVHNKKNYECLFDEPIHYLNTFYHWYLVSYSAHSTQYSVNIYPKTLPMNFKSIFTGEQVFILKPINQNGFYSEIPATGQMRLVHTLFELNIWDIYYPHQEDTIDTNKYRIHYLSDQEIFQLSI